MDNSKVWAELPCEIRGYDMTVGKYAKLIQDCVSRGQFSMALHYLKAAEANDTINKLELAVVRPDLGIACKSA
jgi:hypothetical protein